MDEKRLIREGVPAETLHPFRIKVEEAGKRWKTLREDYLVMKIEMKEKSQVKLKSMRLEIKRSHREFKTAWQLWLAYARHARTVVRA